MACVLLLLLLSVLGGSDAIRRFKDEANCSAALQGIRSLYAIWRAAGMRYKMKVVVGFYQCIAAVPS
eukprot:3712568-Prymnesium_polylepis.1